jgi:hypothetical protein
LFTELCLRNPYGSFVEVYLPASDIFDHEKADNGIYVSMDVPHRVETKRRIAELGKGRIFFDFRLLSEFMAGRELVLAALPAQRNLTRLCRQRCCWNSSKTRVRHYW